jgi:exosortase
LLVLHARQIWMRPQYQFFPLALIGAAVLAYLRLRGLGPLTPPPARRAWPPLLAAWVLLAAAELLYSSWLGAAAAMAASAAMLYAIGGRRLCRAALPAWLLLWLTVPPPFELDRQLILWLQSLTARWASALLDVIGLSHVMAGNVVELGGRRLLVEEACSGVNSLFSALACTLFYIFLVRRPPVRAVLLLAAAAGWVLAANVVRVAGVAYFAARWGIDLTDAQRHEALGAGMFVAALGLIWSTDRLLLFLAAPSVPPKAAAAGPAAGDTPRTVGADPGKGVAVTWAFAAAYLILLAIHVGLYGGVEASAPAANDSMAAAVDKLDADSLPERLERWSRQGYYPESRNPGSEFGEHSKTWTFQAGPQTAALSLDYTFPGWHDLTRCYTGQGWTIDEQAVRKASARDDGPTERFVALKLTKPGYRSGYLVFSQFDRDGAPLEPRLGAAYLSLYRQEAALHRWWSGLHGDMGLDRADPTGPVYQLQLFVESYSPLTPAEQSAAEALFLCGLRTLGKGLRTDEPPAPERG